MKGLHQRLLPRVPAHQAGFLISGQSDWTLEQLALASKVFKQPLQYFLESASPNLPKDIELVKSLEGGQPIVWRSPQGVDATPRTAKSQLGYVNLAASPALLDTARRALMVFELWDDRDDPLFWRAEEGLLYLINDAGIRPYLCVRSNADSAVFTPTGAPDAVPLIVPARRQSTTHGHNGAAVLGRVIGLMSTY